MMVTDQVPIIITARGGSKGIPRKNLASCGGCPLIAWTIVAARKARLAARVLVSTDDPEIAAAAQAAGADVPFLRPAELAGDHSSHVDVMKHAVSWLETQGTVYEYVALVQPTCPLILPEDVDGALELALRTRNDSVITVTPAEHHPYYSHRLRPDGTLEYFWTEGRNYHRRQDLPSAYDEAGAIYVLKRNLLFDRNVLEAEHPLAYVLPRERALDIDAPWDLHLADLILRERVSEVRP